MAMAGPHDEDRSSAIADVPSGVEIPDSRIAREATEFGRRHEGELLFNHSVRVYLFGAMKGLRQSLKIRL